MITDDSGFLGIIDPDRYESFVDENWTFESIRAHIVRQMAQRRILMWSTGGEGTRRLAITTWPDELRGHRHIVGPIEVSVGRLCLVNYETISMAAQFKDVAIPEKHMEDCVFSLPSGLYQCRITQTANPDETTPSFDESIAHFVLAFEMLDTSTLPWTDIAWNDS